MSDQPSARQVILIADDERMNRELMRSFLENAGHTVVVAESGPRALELARQHQPIIAVLDVRMAGMTGFETCSRLKEDAETATIKVLLFSAMDSPHDRAHAVEVKADGYLSKA